MRPSHYWIVTIGLAAALCSANDALAQATVGAVTPPSNVDVVIDTMRGASVIWMEEMLKMGALLYASLLVMEWMIRSGYLALQGGADVKAVFILFFQLILRRGSWGGIIASGSLFLPNLVRGFHEAGVRAGNAAAGAVAGGIAANSGRRPAVTPQALAEGVFEFAVAQWENLSVWTPDLLTMWSSIVMSTLVVVISFGLCSLFTWFVYIRAYLKLGGAVLLGFGGSSVTEHIAKSYLQSLVSAGVSLMMIELVKSLVFPFLNSWIDYAKQDPSISLQTSWRMALGGFAMAVCIISIPNVSQSMVSGGGGGQTAEGMTLAAIWTAMRAASGIGAALSPAAGAAASGLGAVLSAGGTPPPSGAGGAGVPSPPSPPPLPSGGGAGAAAGTGGSGATAGGSGGSNGGGAPTGPIGPGPSGSTNPGGTGQGPIAGASTTASNNAQASSSWDSRIGPAASHTAASAGQAASANTSASLSSGKGKA